MAEQNLHSLIDRCQMIIVNNLRDVSPECSIILNKDRIDETNIAKVNSLVDDYLANDPRSATVKKALDFLRRALDSIVLEHYEWAIQRGEFFGNIYQVCELDRKSLALEGLYKAAVRYKPSGSFKAYAAQWIRQVIQRSKDENIYYTLDGPKNDDNDTSRLSDVSYEDSLWGNNQNNFSRDPFFLEDLRATYCPHLSLSEVAELVQNRELAEDFGL